MAPLTPQSSIAALRARVLHGLRHSIDVVRRQGPSQFQFWLIALIIGVAAGFAALGFRKGIHALERWAYGAPDTQAMHSFAATLPWQLLLAVPIAGGLATGAILHVFTRDARARAVADVIEGAALRDGRVETRAGLASAAASLITLGTGGSSGREGPVVHLAAVISTWVCRRINASGMTGRDLLGCAVAAAVSASFNTPIAGALFALEVVLRHFAVHAFAPIVIASVAGTIINRLAFGDVTEFVLPGSRVLQFYVELPAFMLLGLCCGLVAVILMRAIFWADDLGNYAVLRFGVPRWLRPALAGALLGALAIAFPHIIGVGYETTSRALTGQLLLWQAIVFAMVKTVALAITMAGRMGGGVFSPSLMVGALTGLAFGIIATGIFPDVSGTPTLYALAGMGAVAAAVLGAPISTTLIVFELTGDWQTGLAVMVAVSLSTALASRLVDRSFFLTQLERRGVRLAAGPQAYLPGMIAVSGLMRRAPPAPLEPGQLHLTPGDTLEQAIPMFEAAQCDVLPVAERGQIVATLRQVDALKAFAQALSATAAEEHS